MDPVRAALLLALVAAASASPRHKRSFFGTWINPPDSAQLIVENGYPAEQHTVTTEDGYILTVFRIPYGRNQLPGKRPPIILQHGILCSSDCWLLSIPEKGLGYRLADAGYDVWLGNNRGNTYSMKHVNLTTSDKQFWNYSFHEMGYYDLPAMIDYILNVTENQQLTYIAHSQGTTQFFAMASTRPEYNNKLLVASMLAPVAFLDGTEGAIRILSKFAKYLSKFAQIFGINHVLEHSFIITVADKLFCRPTSWFRPACDSIFYIVTGFDSPQLNKTLVETIASYSPAGASIKQLMHFAQLTDDGDKFCMFDYGKSDNMNYYGQASPPNYNLTAITVPLVLHYARNDYISRPKNVMKLKSLIANAVDTVLVPYDKFNHIDFMWAIDVNPLLYDGAIDIIKRYIKKDVHPHIHPHVLALN